MYSCSSSFFSLFNRDMDVKNGRGDSCRFQETQDAAACLAAQNQVLFSKFAQSCSNTYHASREFFLTGSGFLWPPEGELQILIIFSFAV
jgi:hypothetical protein